MRDENEKLMAVARAVYPAVIAFSEFIDVPFDEAMRRPRYQFLREATLAFATAVDAVCADNQF